MHPRFAFGNVIPRADLLRYTTYGRLQNVACNSVSSTCSSMLEQKRNSAICVRMACQTKLVAYYLVTTTSMSRLS